jgi:2-oxoglutarate ferredoxin oxidoreductase subunit gamma
MKENGIMILNKTLIPREVKRSDVRVLQIDAHDVARKLGSERVVNMILLGAYVEVEKSVSLESVKEALKKYLTGRKAELLEVNIKALKEGSKIAKDFLGG